MKRPKVGDLVLVTGTAHFEKAEIITRKKGIYTLNNGIKMDRTLKPLNSKCKIREFHESEYEFLLCQREIPRFLKTIGDNFKACPHDTALKLSKKLKKLTELVS